MRRFPVFALAMLLLCAAAPAQQAPAHRYDPALDASLTTSGVLLNVVALSRWHDMEAWSEPVSSPLPWDRPFRGTWSGTADAWSDGLLWTGLAVPALWGAEWGSGRVSGDETAADFAILGEAMLLNYGLNILVRSAQWWSRPMLFSSDSPRGERSKAQAHASFYSGHVSSAVTMATVAAVVNGSREKPLVPRIPFAVGVYGLATTVAALRVGAGKHWPTDVVAGAAVGSAIGWVVPFLHEVRHAPAPESGEETRSAARKPAVRFQTVSLYPLVVAWKW